MQLERMPPTTQEEEELERGLDGMLQSESSPWIQSLPVDIHSRRLLLPLVLLVLSDGFSDRLSTRSMIDVAHFCPPK